MKRREFLLGALAIPCLRAQSRVTDRIAVLDVGGANVLALSTGEGLVVVDSGPPKSAIGLPSPANVRILFNTHYHADQTGHNESFAAAGAKIIAHERTRQWLSSDYWVPAEDRYEKALHKAAWPTEVFETTGSWKVENE